MTQKTIEIFATTFVNGKPVTASEKKPVTMDVSEEDYNSLVVGQKGRAPGEAKRAGKRAAKDQAGGADDQGGTDGQGGADA